MGRQPLGPLYALPKSQQITLAISFVKRRVFSQVAHRKVVSAYHGDALPSELRGPAIVLLTCRFTFQRANSSLAQRSFSR